MKQLTLGERLKKARIQRGLTQDNLADLLGTSRGVITNLEHDKIENPKPLIIKSICTILEINQDWLLYGTATMDDNCQAYNSKVLSDIYTLSKELTPDEQAYILDIIKLYKKHIIEKKSN